MSAPPGCVYGRPRLLLTAMQENPTLLAGRRLAEQHPPRGFDIAEASGAADVVLFMEHGYIGLVNLPHLSRLVRARPRARHFLFSESDWPYAVLPGAYPSLTKALPWARSWSYLPDLSRLSQDRAVATARRPHLFSFLGRVETHPVRQRLLVLDSPHTPCLDSADAPSRFPDFDYTRTYIELLSNSSFALCPRGFGASSIRLFEAMAWGRAPVIISDAWQRPPGIDWEEFSLIVAESEVMHIPEILLRSQARAERMGQRAREIFRAHFAPEVFFDRMLASLLADMTDHGSAISARAWRALGWREFYSIGHLAKSKLGKLSGRLPS